VATMIRGFLKNRVDAYLHAVHGRLLRWTRPAARAPVRGAIADVTMTKAALVAENALLRQHVSVLRCQVTRPAVTPTDRLLLVLLAHFAHD